MAEVNNFYVEQTSLQATVDTAFINVSGTTILGSSLAPNTKYLIIAKALFGGDNASGDFLLRIRTADDTTIESKSEAMLEPTFTANDELEPYFFVHSYSTDGTPNDIRFQLRTNSAIRTARVDQLSLLLIDLDDLGSDNYFEDINADDSVELDDAPTFTTLANLSAADLGIIEEWLLLGYARIEMGSTGRNFDVRLMAANDGSSQVEMNYHSAEGEDTGNLRVVGVAGRHKAVTSNVAAAIQALEEAANGNHLNRGGYLIALKTSAFADFEFAFNSGDISVSTTETTLATITDYTPSTATNHLIVGRCNLNDTGGNSRIATYVENGAGTNLMAGDDVAFQTQNWDDTDLEMACSSMRESLPASQDTFDLQGILDTGETSRNFEYRWLLMLNLEKADGIPPAGWGPLIGGHRNRLVMQ